ncbi:hypothetical protein [Carboxylicivirga caseinilyticus]|uniref:hypothetical protein n=1 Tax=Carboxylicivirga caseinilyticus TaxID=3417572 RepID=UPI003D3491C8|nr:hypothetical protein [Marinilabiliaceae bacterium A049]
MLRLQLFLFALLVGFVSKAQETSMIAITSDSTKFSSIDSLLYNRFVLGHNQSMDTLPNPFHMGVEVGTSVSTDFNGGFGTNLYVAPQFWYVPNEKWQFNIAPVLSRSTFHDMPVWIAPGYVASFDGTATHIGLYAQGSYNINEKLYVGSSVMGNIQIFEQNLSGQSIPDLNSIATSAFVGYKFSNGFRVEAEFGIGRNLYGFYNSWSSPMTPYMITPRTRNPYDRF